MEAEPSNVALGAEPSFSSLTEALRAFVRAAGDANQLAACIVERTAKLLSAGCSLCMVADGGGGLLNSASTAELAVRLESSSSSSPSLWPAGDPAIRSVLESRRPLLVPAPDEELPQLGQGAPLLLAVGAHSCAYVPLLSNDRAIGVLVLVRFDSEPQPLNAGDLLLAAQLAEAAAIALEYADLHARAGHAVKGRQRLVIENAVLLADLGQQVDENKKAEVKFRGLLESAPDAIVIIDNQGRIVLINAQTESLFGYSRSELLGQAVEMLVPASYRAQHPSLRSGYFRAPRLRHAMAAGVDLFGLKKDGTEFAAEISLSPITTPDGQLVTAVIRDITERKRLEESRARTLELETQNRRIQEANRLKSEFLANMSHELRTPLNAIIGFSALLHAGRVGSLTETQTEYLGDILVSSRHLLQLINDVLDLAKVEAGRIDLQPEAADLKRITTEVRDILRGLAAEKHVAISLHVDADLREVVTDIRLLKQILYNYLSNAIKFTPEQGAVRVSIVACEDDMFSVRVEDNGIGIKPDDIDRLFVEFQQLDSSAGKKYPGTGLGLALTKRIVEAQGGSVDVASVLGKGSVFSAHLPRAPKPS